MTAAFHLNNRKAKRKLKVYNNGRLLRFCPTPTYLGVKLDKLLMFRHHLMALRKIYGLYLTWSGYPSNDGNLPNCDTTDFEF